MEATVAERHASGGPGRGLYAQNLALAFEATVERLGDDPAIVSEDGDERRTVTWAEYARARTPDRRRAGEARRRQGRHRRDDDEQPAGVLRHRHGRGLARRGAVLDLPDLFARADPVRRAPTPAPRWRSSRARSSRSSTRRARTCRRSRRWSSSTAKAAITPWMSSSRWIPSSTSGASVAVGRARRPADPDLHLGHDGTAEGRPALAPQPDVLGRIGERDRRVPGPRRQGDLLAAQPPTSPIAAPTTTCP